MEKATPRGWDCPAALEQSVLLSLAENKKWLVPASSSGAQKGVTHATSECCAAG